MKRRAFFVLFAVVLLCAVGFGAQRWRQFARLEAVKAELRAEGIPLSEAEWTAKYVTAPEGFPEFDAALAAVARDSENGDGRWKLGVIGSVVAVVQLNGGDVSGYDAAEVQRYLDFQAENMAAVAEAAEAIGPLEPGGSLPVAPYNPDGVIPLWHAADLFYVRTQFRVTAVDREGAVADAITVRRLAARVSGFGTFRYRVHESAAKALARILFATPLTTDDIDGLSAVWREGNEEREWRTFTEFARCGAWSKPADLYMGQWQQSFSRDIQFAGERSMPDRVLDFLAAPRTATYWLHEPADRACMLEGYGKHVAITAGPPESWFDRMGQLADWADTAPRAYHRVHLNSGFSASDAWSAVNDLTWTRVIATALAIERYRLDGGTVPETLDQLVPAYLDTVPIDPWTGDALQFPNATTKRYIIQTAGPKGRSKGGESEYPRIEVVRP